MAEPEARRQDQPGENGTDRWLPWIANDVLIIVILACGIAGLAAKLVFDTKVQMISPEANVQVPAVPAQAFPAAPPPDASGAPHAGEAQDAERRLREQMKAKARAVDRAGQNDRGRALDRVGALQQSRDEELTASLGTLPGISAPLTPLREDELFLAKSWANRPLSWVGVMPAGLSLPTLTASYQTASIESPPAPSPDNTPPATASLTWNYWLDAVNHPQDDVPRPAAAPLRADQPRRLQLRLSAFDLARAVEGLGTAASSPEMRTKLQEAANEIGRNTLEIQVRVQPVSPAFVVIPEGQIEQHLFIDLERYRQMPVGMPPLPLTSEAVAQATIAQFRLRLHPASG